MSCLEEQWTDPYILPVDETGDMISFNEYVGRMDIPMPQGGSYLISLRQDMFTNVQKLPVKNDVSSWCALRFGRCK